MPKCKTCGAKASFMMVECDDCMRRRNEAIWAAAPKPAPPPPMLAPEMIATGAEIVGHRAARSLGVVRGLSVRSRSVVGNMAASAQMIFGGQITAFETLCEDARTASFDRLRVNAAAMGADAVVGLRYDATEVAEGVTEVLCYGTAVTLRRDDA